MSMKCLGKFAYSIFYLLIYCSSVFANTSRCYEIVANSDKEFFNVHLDHDLAPSVVKALADNNITRPGFLTPPEINRLQLTDKPVHLVIGQAHVSDSRIPGEILSPTARGTVVSPAASDITPKKSEELLLELQKAKPVGEINLFTNIKFSPELFKSLEAQSISYEVDRYSGYAKVDDHVIIDEFIKHLQKEINVPALQVNYIRTVLQNMIASARWAQGPNYQKNIDGIRMRWKDSGQGKDFDTVHTDRPSAIATSLTLIGHGTEIFHVENATVEVRSVPENYISHMLGNLSGRPVDHRASTKPSRRLVFLIFWGAS